MAFADTRRERGAREHDRIFDYGAAVTRLLWCDDVQLELVFRQKGALALSIRCKSDGRKKAGMARRN